jgi:hypothetical protein
MSESAQFDQYLAILYSVLETPLGLVVACTHPGKAKYEFEQARAKDATLAGVKIMLSKTNPNNELWIVRT